jgi:hypothetical protein
MMRSLHPRAASLAVALVLLMTHPTGALAEQDAGATSQESALAAALSDPAAPERAEVTRLVEAHNRWAAALRTVRAGGRARVGAERQRPRAFDFSMVLSRPSNARIQGRWGSLATLFDLSGGGNGWTLYLPRDRAVVRAPEGEASAGLLLPPTEIYNVLLPAGIPPRDLEERGAASLEGDSLRVVVPPGRGGAGSPFHRVLWLDRRDGKPYRLEIRRESQLEAPLLVAEYEKYEGKGAEAFPVHVTVRLQEGGQWARFVFETVRINTEVAPATFDLRIPAGTRELAPEDLSPDFLPEAEEEK